MDDDGGVAGGMTSGEIRPGWAIAWRSRDEVARLKAEVKSRKFSYTLWHPLFWRCGIGVAPVGLLGFYPFIFYTCWSFLTVWGVLYGIVSLCLLVPPAYRLALSAVPMLLILCMMIKMISGDLRKPSPSERVKAVLATLGSVAILAVPFWVYATSTSDHWAISSFWQTWLGLLFLRDLCKWRQPETESLDWWADCWRGQGAVDTPGDRGLAVQGRERGSGHHPLNEAEIAALIVALRHDKLDVGLLRPLLWRYGWMAPPPLFIRIATDGLIKMVFVLLILRGISAADLMNWALFQDTNNHVGLLIGGALLVSLGHLIRHLEAKDEGRVRPWRDYVDEALARAAF